MVLCVLADASYLSHPKAGSVAGSFHFLGMHEPTPVLTSHPVSAHSTRIPVVCSFSGKAEYGGAYDAATIATEERRILANMGHPQPPIPLYCDNECAIGLASDTIIRPKMSKSIDMRFHWLQDRVRQGQFVIRYVPGLQNITDFFTKALPVARHKLLTPYVALDDSESLDDRLQAELKLSSLSCAALLTYNSHHAGVLMPP
jgi:hypothetical protein